MNVPLAWFSLSFVFGFACVLGTRYQNNGSASKESQKEVKPRIGGPISPHKSFWLFFAVLNWFFLPLILAQQHGFSENFKLTIYGFSFLMWFRGIAECIMLYVTLNWRPLYGMIHNMTCLSFLVFMGALMIFDPGQTGSSQKPFFENCYLVFLCLMLMVETYYAWSFSKLVGLKTQGNDAIWFATEQEAKFAAILKTTRIWNRVFSGIWIFLSIMVAT
jgi:hypothetical protein